MAQNREGAQWILKAMVAVAGADRELELLQVRGMMCKMQGIAKVDGARRPQRGKLGDAELEQPGWSVEVLESVRSEIFQRLILEERRGRG